MEVRTVANYFQSASRKHQHHKEDSAHISGSAKNSNMDLSLVSNFSTGSDQLNIDHTNAPLAEENLERGADSSQLNRDQRIEMERQRLYSYYKITVENHCSVLGLCCDPSNKENMDNLRKLGRHLKVMAQITDMFNQLPNTTATCL